MLGLKLPTHCAIAPDAEVVINCPTDEWSTPKGSSSDMPRPAETKLSDFAKAVEGEATIASLDATAKEAIV